MADRTDQPDAKGTATMKLTTNTNVSVDGVIPARPAGSTERLRSRT